MLTRKNRPFLSATNTIVFILIFTTCIFLYCHLVPEYHWTTVNALRTSETPFITQKISIVQPFIVPWGHFSAVRVLLYNKGSSYAENSILDLTLYDAFGTVITSIKIPATSIINGQFITLQFPEISASRLQHYYLQVSTVNLTEGITIASSSQAQSSDLAYFLNGKGKSGTLSFDMRFSKPGINGQVLFIILLVSGLLWFIFLACKSIIAFLNRTPLFVTVSSLVFIFGLAFLIVEPPLQMFDEPEHFRRVWEVSTGKLTSTTLNNVLVVYLPENIQKTFDRISRSFSGSNQNPIQLFEMLLEKPGDPGQLSLYPGQTTAYSFYAYLLPALFVKLTSPMVSALGLTYVARLASLLEYTILTVWALKNARRGKYAIAVVAILPFVLSVGIAINVDVLLFGGSFLYLSSVVNIAYPLENTEFPSWSEILGVIVGAFCILISKHVYYPLLALVLLIPRSRFGGRSQKLLTVAIFWLVTLLFAASLQASMPPTSDLRIDMTNINSNLQIDFLLANPINVIKVILNTLILYGPDYANQFMELTLTDHKLEIFGLIQVVLVLGFAWMESGDFFKKIRLPDYLLFLAVILMTVVTIMAPLYLRWTPVGSPIVMGIQGRYFVPAFTLFLLFIKLPLKCHLKNGPSLFFAAMTILLLYFLGSTILFFY